MLNDDYPVKTQEAEIEEDEGGHPVAWLLIETHEPLDENDYGHQTQNLLLCREDAIASIEYDLRNWYKVRGLTPSQLHRARTCVRQFTVSVPHPSHGNLVTWQIQRLNVWPFGVKKRMAELQARNEQEERDGESTLGH